MTRFFLNLIILCLGVVSLTGQLQVDASFPFQNDPAKKYSLVIPSSYSEDTPISAFLALHPWNPARWNAQSWCKELTPFAEANGVILICPDGDVDGQIDDPIDTAFTSVLLDSAFFWYNINLEKLYVIGFSWGGKTTYTYGLSHIDKFAGLIPIGAVISTTEVSNIIQQAEGIPFYLIHGDQDAPDQRYAPLRIALEKNGACVDGILLPGVGHTIDFPNQLQILTTAYDYLLNNPCLASSTYKPPVDVKLNLLSKHLFAFGEAVRINNKGKEWIVHDISGKMVNKGTSDTLHMDFGRGVFFISTQKNPQKFVVE